MLREHGVAGIDPHKNTATMAVIDSVAVDVEADRSRSMRPGSVSC